MRPGARGAGLFAACALAMAAAAHAQPVPLTLADATARALERLPAVAIQRDAIEIAAQREVRAAAAYDPVLRFEGRARTHTDPLNTLFVGAPPGALGPRTTGVQTSVAWSRLFQGGGTLAVTGSLARDTTNGRFALLSPAWLTSAGLEFRQPLRAGRRIDAQRHAVKVSALDATRSRAALERVVSDTVAATERAYWAVLARREDVQTREQSLTRAEAQRDDVAVRIEAGTAAEADAAAPLAEIARRRADLVRARDEATRAAIALRHLMAGSTDAPDWSLAFAIADEPPPPPRVAPVDVLVAEALARRAELDVVEAERQMAALDTALARDRTRTQVDLVASYTLRGLAGRENEDMVVPFPGASIVVPSAQQGGLDDALQTLAMHRFSDAWVGVTIGLPVGRRAAKADMEAATIAERRTHLLRDQIARRIAAEVRTAAAALTAARERVDAAQALDAAAIDLLAAEQARFDTGQSSTFLLLTRQTEREQAALALTAARADAALATTELLRATGQLLERRGITLAAPAIDKGTSR